MKNGRAVAILQKHEVNFRYRINRRFFILQLQHVIPLLH